jgi:hypothetical protein
MIASENAASAFPTENINAAIAANNFSNGFVPPSRNKLDTTNIEKKPIKN